MSFASLIRLNGNDGREELMTMVDTSMPSADERAAAAGDEAAFTALTRRHRRENAALVTRQEVEAGEQTVPHVAWLQPYPDRLIDSADAESAVLRRETIELAYLVALQHLPPRQRAVLILRDVLDWSAEETASLLDSSVPAVNGALQRARATLRTHRPQRDAAPPEPPERERSLLQQYVEMTERCDIAGLTTLLSYDARFSMPPNPMVFVGAGPVMQSMVEGGFGQPPYDDWRCLLTRANGMPAVACYLRKDPDGPYEAFAVDVLRIEHGAVVEITGFSMENLTDAFGLPQTLR
jgi:RNA polymerase sigma-70 factor (ECF subfamily)